MYQVMTYSVLYGDIMVQNGIFWTIEEDFYFVYYPIISYQKINVYMDKNMDMGRFLWNNGVRGNQRIVSSVVLLYKMRNLW